MSWPSRISKKCYFFIFRFFFKLGFLSHYRFELLHHELSLKINSCRGELSWKTVDFRCCIKVFIVQSFQKKPLLKKFSRHSHSSSFVTQNYRLHFFYQSLRCWISSILVSAESLRFVEIHWQVKPLIFPSHQHLDSPETPKNGITLYLDMQGQLWPQLQASILQPTWQSNGFRFWRVLLLLTNLSVPCNWLVIVQKCQEVFFKMESTRFSRPGFPITTNLIYFFKVSTEMLPTWN